MAEYVSQLVEKTSNFAERRLVFIYYNERGQRLLDIHIAHC